MRMTSLSSQQGTPNCKLTCDWSLGSFHKGALPCVNYDLLSCDNKEDSECAFKQVPPKLHCNPCLLL